MIALHSLLTVVLAATLAVQAEPPLRIYIDADMSHNVSSGTSIELGARTALDLLGGKVGDRSVELVVLDHRGNSRRSARNLGVIAEDDSTLAVIGGMHSPPLIAERGFIHEEELLVLVPWAAAGPITRYEASPNWVFRLSVDDTKAGEVLVHHAIETLGGSTPHLVLERTAWGRSNETTMLDALKRRGILDPTVHWIDWGIGETRAEQLARQTKGADSILLVANSKEATEVIHALDNVDSPAHVVSHWGVMGGPLAGLVSERQEGSVSVIQTRAVSALEEPNGIAKRAHGHAVATYPKLLLDGKVATACGFIHAHDLVLLLDAAVRQAGPAGSVLELRRATRGALEELKVPVQGALKTYVRPFGPAGPKNRDAHEALSTGDLEMYSISVNGTIQAQ